MRLLVDAMCAEFGGIRTYVDHVFTAWITAYPEDELHVIVPQGSGIAVPGATMHEVAIPRPAQIGRPLAQTRATLRLAREVKPDGFLATLPSTSLIKPRGIPTVVVFYDLRHELLPEQFSAQQRALRSVSYRRSYQIADGIASISQRSLDDLHERHPRTRRSLSAVAHLGADHVSAWPAPEAPSGPAITFGHHSNKNLDLILRAWASDQTLPALLVLGVSASNRASLEARLSELGLEDRIGLAPFLPDAEFQQAIASARMIVFPSSFEGFGLPVVEGMALGIPVVIGPERATTEVAGGHAFRAEDWSPEALAIAVRAADAADERALASARLHAQTFRWERTASITRELFGRASHR
ncbi:MAG TPA: glycosyltransferase [Marmoricola sp.]|nr:glycosyltransferase [Marmoricola sp.]